MAEKEEKKRKSLEDKLAPYKPSGELKKDWGTFKELVHPLFQKGIAEDHIEPFFEDLYKVGTGVVHEAHPDADRDKKLEGPEKDELLYKAVSAYVEAFFEKNPIKGKLDKAVLEEVSKIKNAKGKVDWKEVYSAYAALFDDYMGFDEKARDGSLQAQVGRLRARDSLTIDDILSMFHQFKKGDDETPNHALYLQSKIVHDVHDEMKNKHGKAWNQNYIKDKEMELGEDGKYRLKLSKRARHITSPDQAIQQGIIKKVQRDYGQDKDRIREMEGFESNPDYSEK